jgi:hypothetical protein
MSGSGKSIREALVGKDLIGFRRSSEQAGRSSSAKVSVTKDPKKFGLNRSSSTKVDIVKAPEQPVDGSTKPASSDRT